MSGTYTSTDYTARLFLGLIFMLAGGAVGVWLAALFRVESGALTVVIVTASALVVPPTVLAIIAVCGRRRDQKKTAQDEQKYLKRQMQLYPDQAPQPPKPQTPVNTNSASSNAFTPPLCSAIRSHNTGEDAVPPPTDEQMYELNKVQSAVDTAKAKKPKK